MHGETIKKKNNELRYCAIMKLKCPVLYLN